MLRLDCLVPSASSVEVGEAQVALRRRADARGGGGQVWTLGTQDQGLRPQALF